MAQNIAAIIKQRFGYEPGDEQFYSTVQKISKNPNYGLDVNKTIAKKASPQQRSKKYNGLGGKALEDEMSRRNMFGGGGTGIPDLKGIFSKAFNL
jgi:hypothetical protein